MSLSEAVHDASARAPPAVRFELTPRCFSPPPWADLGPPPSGLKTERVLNATDVTKPLGLRDRALLETLYSTGMRCSELVALGVY